jgi:hypothetical protein
MKIKIVKDIITRTKQEVEVELITEPVFIQEWNYKNVIGIFPSKEEYSGKEWYTFHVYMADEKSCSYHQIASYNVIYLEKEPHSMNIPQGQKIFVLLTKTYGFGGEISKETFYQYYNAFREKTALL